MRQVFQDLAGGSTSVIDVPAPQARPNHVVVRTMASVISPGTERMVVEFGRANLLQKARQQPDRVRDVVDKARTDGLRSTAQAVRSKLGQPLPLGYAMAGVVASVGQGVQGFDVGQPVAGNGPHAELASVPQNLCATIPTGPAGEQVAFEEAAFASIGAIALQGCRLAQPTLGERVVVTGLGLVGLLAVQILRAQGCEVLGLDFAADRLALARQFGAATVDLAAGQDPVAAALDWTSGRGVDAVVIAASTDSDEPVHQAATMCRTRGRVVLVGQTGLHLRRADFYQKEISFQVSSSYGPGRYDTGYEEGGQDYPFGHVRWTAGRNLEAFLGLLASQRIDLQPLITHRSPIEEAGGAYESLADDKSSLGIVLTYAGAPESTDMPPARTVAVRPRQAGGRRGRRVAVIGAGGYTRQVLLPALAATPAELDLIVSRGGADARHAADQFGFARAGSDVDAVFEDPTIDAIVITTRHDTHAALAARAVEAGKHVYVEKPLAITTAQLEDLERRYAALEDRPVLMVGFNRRFAPLAVEMKDALRPLPEPKTLIATMNAGAVPPEHWVHDPVQGGGRIVGEACHHIDLLRFLAGQEIVDVRTIYLDTRSLDTASIQLRFADGSIGTVHYVATGNKSFPKERVEAFAGGCVLQLDNFRTMRVYGMRGPKKRPSFKQDKGHAQAVGAFITAIESAGLSPIPWDEVLDVSRATLQATRDDRAS